MNAGKGLGYLIKTFGVTKADVTFNRLPKVIRAAREAIPGEEVVGYLMCALEKPPQMTGLIFVTIAMASRRGCRCGLPVVERFYREGYLVVRARGGGLFVVAQWYYSNGALRPFIEVH